MAPTYILRRDKPPRSSSPTPSKAHGMMGERFKRDANNGYPRYIGVADGPVRGVPFPLKDLFAGSRASR